MLKWTSSSTQRLAADTPTSSTSANAVASANTMRTSRLTADKRRKRRATIANKENIPLFASTPMVTRTRNSPLVLAPLTDILNVTPEAISSRTPERRRVSFVPVNNNNGTNARSSNRRHSSVGFTITNSVASAQYATTLPKYEEEYSPSTVLPTGQQLALRGLLPDPFMGNLRYFKTPEVYQPTAEVKQPASSPATPALPKKRKLEQDFVAIAKEEAAKELHSNGKKKQFNNTTILTSNRMGDQTLDNLIDAILDSACKDEKKKKPRKSFNLRRRTLLKNQVETVNDLMLSPSYAAGDDPASDLSFLNSENMKPLPATTPQPASPIFQLRTPLPATPLPGTPIASEVLLQLPTPAVRLNDTFNMDTPPIKPCLKRRSESVKSCQNSSAKKYKVDSRNYFEIGLALPSIYV